MKTNQISNLIDTTEKKPLVSKNILVLAEGMIGKNLFAWIRKSKISSNKYTINCKNLEISCLPNSNIEYIQEDVTSAYRVENILKKKAYESVFIVMTNKEEAILVLNNIRAFHEKIRIVFVNRWEGVKISDDYTIVLDRNEIVASQLYTRLPNIPTIAKDIGLGQGELMEVLIANGTTYVHKTFASLMSQEESWKLVGVYRKKEFFFPKENQLILPNDTLLLAGKPSVLESLYKKINDRQGVFPAPFGKHIALIINLRDSIESIKTHIDEVCFFKMQLQSVPNIFIYTKSNDAKKMKAIEKFIETKDNDTIILKTIEEHHTLTQEIEDQEVGVIFVCNDLFIKRFYQDKFYQMKIPVFIFGTIALFNIEKSTLLLGKKEDMERISTTVLDIAQTFDLHFCLCNYEPDGHFEEEEIKNIEKHYETLAHLFDFEISIEHKKVNPIRELAKKDDFLHIIPFNNEFRSKSIFEILAMSLNQQFLNKHKYPKLLIPTEA